MKLCDRCQAGNHPHDRHNGTEGPAGTDGGCGRNVGGDIHQGCECDVILPPITPDPHCPTCTCPPQPEPKPPSGLGTPSTDFPLSA